MSHFQPDPELERVLEDAVRAHGHDVVLLTLGLHPGPIAGGRNQWWFSDLPLPHEGVIGKVVNRPTALSNTQPRSL